MKRYLWYLPILVVVISLAIYALLAARAPESPVEEKAVPVSRDPLPNPDPIAFLRMCIERYDREVQGYRCVLEKRERIGGRLYRKEVIEVALREHPFSVYLHWVEGARKADRALYLAGENGGQMLIRPHGPLARIIAGDVVKRDVNGPDAREAGRYTMAEFGMKKATERVLEAWEKARAAGTLHVDYRGIEKLVEAGGVASYTLHRTGAPESDGVTDSTFYFDVDHWLQVGSVLKGEGDTLIGDYFFRDIQLNPVFPADQFTVAALKR